MIARLWAEWHISQLLSIVFSFDLLLLSPGSWGTDVLPSLMLIRYRAVTMVVVLQKHPQQDPTNLRSPLYHYSFYSLLSSLNSSII